MIRLLTIAFQRELSRQWLAGTYEFIERGFEEGQGVVFFVNPGKGRIRKKSFLEIVDHFSKNEAPFLGLSLDVGSDRLSDGYYYIFVRRLA